MKYLFFILLFLSVGCGGPAFPYLLVDTESHVVCFDDNCQNVQMSYGENNSKIVTITPIVSSDSELVDTGFDTGFDTGTVTVVVDTETGTSTDTGTDLDTSIGTGNLFFTLIVLPDTQNYTAWRPYVFDAQTQWIADNKDELNIKFVMHSGDIVGSVSNLEQWQDGSNSMTVLDVANIPYSISQGNHDGVGRDTTTMNTYFPVSRFESMQTFGGIMEQGKIDNMYQLVDAPGMPLIIFSTEVGPRDVVLNWIETVSLEHPNRTAIINTHSFLNPDGVRANSNDGYGSNPRYLGLGEFNDGQMMWGELINYQNNISMIFCGHVGAVNGGAYLLSETSTGKSVHQMLSNYQYNDVSPYRGALRIIKVSPNIGTVDVKTYSPYLGEYVTDSNNEFSFSI